MVEIIADWGLIFAMIFLSITVLFLLVRAYLGPQFTDRILSVNIINVKVIAIVCILAVVLDKDYIVDIAILYALFSFLAVTVLARIYLDQYLKDQESSQDKGGSEDA